MAECLPLTSNAELFRNLCMLGEELTALHLMEKTGPAPPSYSETGTNIVDKVRYSEPTMETAGRVWINKDQHFEGVTPEVWAFQIGGYQICQKWLTDRKGRTLTFDDLMHYACICSALSETIRLMEAINTQIEKSGGWPLT